MSSDNIKLADIHVAPNRLRATRTDLVDYLAESMKERGLLQPITARRRSDGGYSLVIGRHRFEAAKLLAWSTIAVTVTDIDDDDEAELAEIDENLIRGELSPAERALHVGRRKELYEKLHPETKHGATGRGGKKVANLATLTIASLRTPPRPDLPNATFSAMPPVPSQSSCFLRSSTPYSTGAPNSMRWRSSLQMSSAVWPSAPRPARRSAQNSTSSLAASALAVSVLNVFTRVNTKKSRRRSLQPRANKRSVPERRPKPLRVCPDTLGRITKFSKHEPN